MKKDIRFVICLVIIILLALLCIYVLLSEKEKGDDIQPDYPMVSVTPTPRTIIVSDGDNNVVLGTISFYTVKLSGRIIEAVEVAVGQGVEISPKLISEYVTDALEDEEIDLEILDIKQEDGICIINFGDGIKKLSTRDGEIEKLVLDAYSMSIVDNCSDINGVTFKIDGKTYSTQHIKISDGEVYLKN